MSHTDSMGVKNSSSSPNDFESSQFNSFILTIYLQRGVRYVCYTQGTLPAQQWNDVQHPHPWLPSGFSQQQCWEIKIQHLVWSVALKFSYHLPGWYLAEHCDPRSLFHSHKNFPRINELYFHVQSLTGQRNCAWRQAALPAQAAASDSTQARSAPALSVLCAFSTAPHLPAHSQSCSSKPCAGTQRVQSSKTLSAFPAPQAGQFSVKSLWISSVGLRGGTSSAATDPTAELQNWAASSPFRNSRSFGFLL